MCAFLRTLVLGLGRSGTSPDASDDVDNWHIELAVGLTVIIQLEPPGYTWGKWQPFRVIRSISYSYA